MTISNDTNPVDAVFHAVFGGKFLIHLLDDNGPGRRYGNVMDNNGNVIGSASDYIYGGRGYAVNTKPYGGFVPEEQVEYV